MPEPAAIRVGSETQYLETLPFATGIQRVMRETHSVLVDRLTPIGADIVPLHTRRRPRATVFRANPYLAPDPVLDRQPIDVAACDVILMLDLHTDVDFAEVFRERRRRRLPVISVVHDIIPITSPHVFGGDPRTVFRLYLQQVFAVSDHVVVTSRKVRADLLSLGWRIPGEIHVIGLGTTFAQRAPEPPPDDRISILYVSTLEPRKGHDVLLAAFDLLRERGRDVDLTIVGRIGWEIDDLVAGLRAHPDLGGRLRWLPGADDLTVATVARGCTVGVFPAVDEGFGLFVEEGLSYGLKMVASDIAAFRERAQPNLSFAARTPEAFADAIEAAHGTAWVPLGPGDVRTMHDFGNDLAALVQSTFP